jgi:hypothetical protein
VLIVTSATVSLLLIGLLAIAITPDRSPSPIAGSSSVGQARRTSAPVAIASTSALTTTLTALPVVTPIGDDGWAVTTAEAVAGETGRIDGRLPSGEVVEVDVVGTDPSAGLVVVTLPESTHADGYQLASDRPGPSDTVYVNADLPKVVRLVDLANLDVEEATPVLDGAGELVGLCTGGEDGTTLRTVDTMPGEDPSRPPAGATTTYVETTAPVTTDDDPTTSTAESTTPESTTPESTTPEATTPESTTPESTIPESTVTTSVETTSPETTVPPTTAADSTETDSTPAGFTTGW